MPHLGIPHPASGALAPVPGPGAGTPGALAPPSRGSAVQFFEKMLKKLAEDPRAQQALLAAGSRIMQPRAPGQTQFGAITAGANVFNETRDRLADEALLREGKRASIAETEARTTTTTGAEGRATRAEETALARTRGQTGLAAAQAGSLIQQTGERTATAGSREQLRTAQITQMNELVRRSKAGGTDEERAINDMAEIIKRDSGGDIDDVTARNLARQSLTLIDSLPPRAEFLLSLERIFAPALAGALTTGATTAILQAKADLLAVYEEQVAESSSLLDRGLAQDQTEAGGAPVADSLIPPSLGSAADFEKGPDGEKSVRLGSGLVIRAVNGEWVTVK